MVGRKVKFERKTARRSSSRNSILHTPVSKMGACNKDKKPPKEQKKRVWVKGLYQGSGKSTRKYSEGSKGDNTSH